MREEIELIVYSAVGLLVLEHLVWWGREMISARPWPRAAIPALAAGLGKALTAGALISLQALIVAGSPLVDEVRNYVRPMVMGGVTVSILSHRWWRTGLGR